MWYSASVLLRGETTGQGSSGTLWTETVFLVRAETEKDAHDKARKLGVQQETVHRSVTGRRFDWKFDTILSVFPLFEDTITDGTTLFSRHLSDTEVQSLKSTLGDENKP